VREERDPVIERLVSELRVLPAVSTDATAQVLARIAGTPAREPAPVVPTPPARRRPAMALPWVVTLAMAATIAGFMIRGVLPAPMGSDASTSTPVAGAEIGGSEGPSVVLAGAEPRALDERAVLVQFVLRAPSASRVSVVGDFNAWDPARDALSRGRDGDLWTVSLPLTPGRHTYAFMVDDSVYTLDPRAPRTSDRDFGGEQSVMLVGRP
jgi:hypothetical protein